MATEVLVPPVVPERVAGSDLLVPLMKLAARRRWRVYLLGGAPGSAETAARVLSEDHGVTIAGWDDCRIGADGSDVGGHESSARVHATKPDLVLVGLGPPKQELWIDRSAATVRPAVALGIGAGLDFLAGRHKRAPRWMARAGFEWAFRLSQEPARLWRRYLIESPRFVLVVFATWMSPRSTRVQDVPPSPKS